jgi:hypothetical protein
MNSKNSCTEEQIKELQKQITISSNSAKKLLKKHNGNIVECILDSYNYKSNIDDSLKYDNMDDTNPEKKCFELRKIMDDKDKIFTNITEK